MAKAADKLAAVTKVRERKDVNFSLTDVKLVDEQDKALNWDLTNSMTSATVELTTQGASTVSLQFEDDDYDFLNDPALAKWAFGIVDVSVSSDRSFSTHRITSATDNTRAGINADFEWVLGQRPIDLYLDTIPFRLCRIATQRTLLTLEFEDRAASLLRDKKGFKTATRGTLTRAGFVAKLCREAGVDYWIPEINVVQPISKSTQTQNAQDLRSSGGAGITTFQGLTQKGQPLTQAQVDIVNLALQVAVSLNAPFNAQVALIEALITENDISNPNPGNSGDEGVLSITASTASGLPFSPFDVGASCNWFLSRGFAGQGGAISIAQGNKLLHPYEIAQAVQGSGAGQATNGASNYGAQEAEATRIVQAYGGGITGGTTTRVAGAYAFTRGPNEDSWDAIQRLASEVSWYAFVRENRLWFVSGNYLFSQQPQLSVARGENGIDYVDVELDTGARDQIAECTIYGRTHLWTALPGMTVQVNNRGPANGKWSVNDVNLDLLDESNGCTTTVQKPLPARPEPAAALTNAQTQGLAVGSFVNTNLGSTTNPVPGAVGSRLDQGFDGTGQSFVAPFNGTVVLSRISDPGWKGGGYIAIQSSADKSVVFYLAEGITPIVFQGMTVSVGDPIATPIPSPYNGIVGNYEMGWANPSNPAQPLAQVVNNPEQMVMGFYQWIQKLGGPTATDVTSAGHA